MSCDPHLGQDNRDPPTVLQVEHTKWLSSNPYRGMAEGVVPQTTQTRIPESIGGEEIGGEEIGGGEWWRRVVNRAGGHVDVTDRGFWVIVLVGQYLG